MPWLDVSEVARDPMFAERLTVLRTTQAVGPNGRTIDAASAITPAPVGVVTSQSDDRLIRGPSAQRRPNMLRVHTKFRLQGPSPGYEPDQLVWNGNTYVVVKVDNFSRFGAGFMAADLQSTNTIDNAPQFQT